MADDKDRLAGEDRVGDSLGVDLTADEAETLELFPANPAFLRKRMAVEAMHEAGQFIDPDDFDLE